MNKKNIIFLTCISIIILLIIFIYKNEFNSLIKFNILEKSNCQKEKKLYYIDEKGVNYYTSCIEKITDNNGVELKILLENKNIDINQIISSKKYSSIYRDGGSKLYEFKNFSILKCNKTNDMDLTKNTDIIIGKKNLNINDGYCSE